MSTIITRLFDSHDQALAAAAELKRHIPDPMISVVGGSRAPGGAAGAVDGLVAAGVPDSMARTYAERMRQGASAVVVRAPFGTAATAKEVMARHRAIMLDLADPYESVASSTPVSDTFGIPALSNDPAPLSSMLGWRVLSTGDSPQASTLDEPAPFSRALGMPILTAGLSNATSSFGMPLLLSGPAPSSSMGLPTLTGGFTFGAPRLSDNPAPVSGMFGLPVLLRDA